MQKPQLFLELNRIMGGDYTDTETLREALFAGDVDEAMLAALDRHARSVGAPGLELTFVPTAKNQPCLDFLRRSGLERVSPGRVFRWDGAQEYPMPTQMAVRFDASRQSRTDAQHPHASAVLSA